ncbi:MAG: HAMP domain-containing protein [Planctomycetia bacterium]|nr:HAMP domain-containing protein [Planctomycetia bacterium]
MDQAVPSAVPPRTRSLKLTISFIAFLAVLPLLVFVAWLSLRESEEKERERLWLVARSDAAATVAIWFDEAYRRTAITEHADRCARDFDSIGDALRQDVRDGFGAAAGRAGCADAALYWIGGAPGQPTAEPIARLGALDAGPAADVLSVAQSGAIRELHRSGVGPGNVHTAVVEASLPLAAAGRVRAVVRIVLPADLWTRDGDAIATGFSAWFDELRSRRTVERALRMPLQSPDALKLALERGVERLRESLRVNGLAVFIAATNDRKERVLVPWLRSGTAPQDTTTIDETAFRDGSIPTPDPRGDPAVVVIPLHGIVPAPGEDAEGRPGVVAVAHFALPSPPARGAGSRFLLILMIALMALVLGFLFFYMNQAISQPIQRLISAMTRGAKGDLQPIAAGGGSGEVAQLALIYNSMAQENRKLMDQIRGFNEQLKTKVRLATGELERRNEELRKANEKLFGLQRELSEQQRLASLGQLAGTMAHELGTPLNAMSGHIELLMSEEGALPADVSKRLKLIGAQIERLSGIIQSNLRQLRAPAPRFVTVDLNALVRGIVSLVTPSVGARKVAIRTSLATDLPSVAGDPAQLEQVLMNLVNNALDAMPGGGSLDLLTMTKEGMACLQVRDSGAGIPREDLGRIFDPFFTTKSPGKGTGLGLSICGDIVKSHSGTIDVQSEPGKGSWFTVRLPAAERVDGSGMRRAAEGAQAQPAAKTT